MKQVTTKSGIKGYECHLQDNYGSFDEFEGYAEMYNLPQRLGFKTAFEAWQANPVIQGSVNPEDFCTVPVQGEGFTPGEWSITTWTNLFNPGHLLGLTVKVGDIRNSIKICDVNIELEEAEANALLIAAAPDMYQFLNDVIDFGVDRILMKKAKEILNRINQSK